MTASEIREMTPQEIEERIEETLAELFHLRYRQATAHLENHRRLRGLRRDIARMKTVLTEKQTGAQA